MPSQVRRFLPLVRASVEMMGGVVVEYKRDRCPDLNEWTTRVWTMETGIGFRVKRSATLKELERQQALGECMGFTVKDNSEGRGGIFLLMPRGDVKWSDR